MKVGGDGARTRFVCGYFGCERHAERLFLAGLPQVIRINLRGDATGEWLENCIRYLVEEADGTRPGQSVLLSKMAEALFVQTSAALHGKPAAGAVRLARRRTRSDRRWSAVVAAPGSGSCMEHRRARFAPRYIAHGAHRALRSLSRRASTHVSRAMAPAARGATTADEQQEYRTDRRPTSATRRRLHLPVRSGDSSICRRFSIDARAAVAERRVSAHCRHSTATSFATSPL